MRMEMAVLQRSCCCCWRPVVARAGGVMAGTIGVPAMVSRGSLGLEAVAKRSTVWSQRQSWAAGWDDLRRRDRRHLVRARRDGRGGARPSTSRAPSRNPSPISKKKTNKEIEPEDDGWEENGFDEDALEALFAQLEMDLEAGESDDVELSEEEAIELENELAAALRDIEEEEEEEEEELRTIDVVAGDTEKDFDLIGDSKSVGRSRGKSGGQGSTIKVRDQFADALVEEYEDGVKEQRIVTLETWQLRKLAAAVEIGRRKVNIKALCAEIGMDRFDVLAWLKNPPPELLMYSATMEDEESAEELPKDGARSSSPAISNPAGNQDVGPDPVGGQNWHSQKRLRKEHEATFERVFSNTDRPSNAIIQNLVELTHVPRKRIVDWFDQRRKVVRVSPKFEALR